MAESEQLVDGPFGAAPCKADPGGRGEAGVITGRAGWVRTRPRHPRVISTSVDGLGSRPEGFPLAGFSLRCPGGQTGQIPSIDETPRPPSEQGTCPLPGLATDNIGYQTASSGSDEAATGLLERYSGGHTQDHTVGYSYAPHKPKTAAAARVAARAQTAAAPGLTLVAKVLIINS